VNEASPLVAYRQVAAKAVFPPVALGAGWRSGAAAGSQFAGGQPRTRRSLALVLGERGQVRHLANLRIVSSWPAH
jgi:hypothetical protein